MKSVDFFADFDNLFWRIVKVCDTTGMTIDEFLVKYIGNLKLEKIVLRMCRGNEELAGYTMSALVCLLQDESEREKAFEKINDEYEEMRLKSKEFNDWLCKAEFDLIALKEA